MLGLVMSGCMIKLSPALFIALNSRDDDIFIFEIQRLNLREVKVTWPQSFHSSQGRSRKSSPGQQP
jgi:hypothetical protein